uniref:Secreted protein n=1 Tax=Aegilops tauschii subsp. strangulata TaxID=200361 RepID=A0A453M7W1_AEGTS
MMSYPVSFRKFFCSNLLLLSVCSIWVHKPVVDQCERLFYVSHQCEIVLWLSGCCFRFCLVGVSSATHCDVCLSSP